MMVWCAFRNMLRAAKYVFGILIVAPLVMQGTAATGVLSAAQRHTHFLVLPPDCLGTYARWLHLMVTQSLQAMGLMVGYGVQIWPTCKTFTSSGYLRPARRHPADRRRQAGYYTDRAFRGMFDET